MEGQIPYSNNSLSEKTKLQTIYLNSVEPVLVRQPIQTRRRKACQGEMLLGVLLKTTPHPLTFHMNPYWKVEQYVIC